MFGRADPSSGAAFFIKVTNMPDQQLTKDIAAWLNLLPEERDIEAGALLLLRINRNKFLYNNIIARPHALAPKLEAELKKHLRIRLDGMTTTDVAGMDRRVKKSAKEIIDAVASVTPEGKHHGRRADHDQLPDDIKAVYDRGLELYKKIKATFERLKTMDKAEPCDRYEYLKILDALDAEYRRGWAIYDNWQPGADVPAGESNELPDIKDVSLARKNLSIALRNEETARERVDEIRGYVATILTAGGGFKPVTIKRLAAIGIDIDVAVSEAAAEQT